MTFSIEELPLQIAEDRKLEAMYREDPQVTIYGEHGRYNALRIGEVELIKMIGQEVSGESSDES